VIPEMVVSCWMVEPGVIVVGRMRRVAVPVVVVAWWMGRVVVAVRMEGWELLRAWSSRRSPRQKGGKLWVVREG
jgi:hypothetical protein